MYVSPQFKNNLKNKIRLRPSCLDATSDWQGPHKASFTQGGEVEVAFLLQSPADSGPTRGRWPMGQAWGGLQHAGMSRKRAQTCSSTHWGAGCWSTFMSQPALWGLCHPWECLVGGQRVFELHPECLNPQASSHLLGGWVQQGPVSPTRGGGRGRRDGERVR